MSRALKRLGAGVLSACAVGLCVTATASAVGPCATNTDASGACPLTTTPTTVTGSLANENEVDYYVFWARPNTHVSLTVNDTENPNCSTLQCTTVYVTITALDDTSEPSFPIDGVPQPESISPVLHRGGVYYAAVSAAHQGNAVFPAPYTLSVNATTTPVVRWPPLCTVPTLRRNTSLYRARVEITHRFCEPGRVRHAYSAHTRRGRVIGLRPRFGRVRPHDSRVRIIVSRGPRPHRHRHHRR